MKPSDRARLTAALREHVAAIAADLRTRMRAPGPTRDRAKQLHADEHVGDDFDVWTDLLSRRASVLWVLKSVYVRVLEDRGLLSPGRLLDPEAQQLFERLAPNLGETAFLRWIYRDLASANGGLPELFSVQPAELALPADERSRALIAFWRHRDADSGAHWSFAEERFEGELMGDLYQELDPVVKDRFALCQTPDFVRSFILDRTLTPAIETFGADTVRLLDPACGSGHFLIDGLKRLVAATQKQHPEWAGPRVVEHALARVVGVDLNDYACALARARLVMTAAELAGVKSLAEASKFHPHVYWADGLEQVERDDKIGVQIGLFAQGDDKPRATFTRSDVRAALKPVLEPKFHAVVANPPYITERDPESKAYHREKIGKNQRYVSAYREYSLGSPFTERCFQLAVAEGFVGIITSNNFMKREFGKPLIEKVLSNLALTLVVDISQAYIPNHSTPTVLLFGTNRTPATDHVHTVMGKRGEAGIPVDPEQGRVWSSLMEGWDKIGFENEFLNTTTLPRQILAKHPWSLGGGGVADIKQHMDGRGVLTLEGLCDEVGRTTVCGEDSAFILPPAAAERVDALSLIRPFVIGEDVRDWAINPKTHVIYPYTSLGGSAIDESHPVVSRHFWPFRTLLSARTIFGKTLRERNEAWFTHLEHYSRRLLKPFSITFAYVATHNHFALDRGGKLFNRSAPVIKLPSKATENEHLILTGLLNSSAACFWMKQMFHNKGLRGQGGGVTATDWEQFFDFDSTKIKLFPVPEGVERLIEYSSELDSLARLRSTHTVDVSLAEKKHWTTVHELRGHLTRWREQDSERLLRMVALQEELDWLCYELYGLDTGGAHLASADIIPLSPNCLPWCLTLAERDAVNRAAVARGEDPGELPTVWFERHRWTQITELPPELPQNLRSLIDARRMRIQQNPALGLIETANFKRRWYRADYEADEQIAYAVWLADRVESLARTCPKAFVLEHLLSGLQDNPRTLAICEAMTGRPDFNLAQLVADVLADESVPTHRFHVYKASGLIKQDAWNGTWEAQRREDAGEIVSPENPPSYVTGDFLRPEYWRHRGKLDVPKERFIAFTEIPGRTGAETLYGWAGWTPLQRIKAILAIDEDLEDAGIPLTDRIALLDSAWRLLPDLAREDAPAAARLKAELSALVGPTGPSREMLEDWRRRFPPPKPPKQKTTRARKPARAEEDDDA